MQANIRVSTAPRPAADARSARRSHSLVRPRAPSVSLDSSLLRRAKCPAHCALPVASRARPTPRHARLVPQAASSRAWAPPTAPCAAWAPRKRIPASSRARHASRASSPTPRDPSPVTDATPERSAQPRVDPAVRNARPAVAATCARCPCARHASRVASRLSTARSLAPNVPSGSSKTSRERLGARTAPRAFTRARWV